jgi:hypothetical protein
MVKIIETNVSQDLDKNIQDFQSRIIVHEGWSQYIEEIKNCDSKWHRGTMVGNTLPRCSKVENLKYDDFHLSCDVYNYINVKSKKLAFLISDEAFWIVENS